MNQFITWFDQEFKNLEDAWRELIESIDEAHFYSPTQQQLFPAPEQILRSARIVEQTFGGITANLWDDPFEWTLPETLTSKNKLIAYLDEARAARKRGFKLLSDDQDLMKWIMTPRGPMELRSLLLDAFVRASHYYLRAKECCRRTIMDRT